jgi:pimeloyl-ACP methyl ester carboxylesterase
LFGDQTMTAQEATAHLRASNGHDAWDALPYIAVPTLVLHGAEDQLTPVDNASLLADRVPGAELRVYPEGRHGFFDEFSSTVNPTVLYFLAMHGAA